jgi:hypothetical protein
MKAKIDDNVILIDEGFQVTQRIGQEWILCPYDQVTSDYVLVSSNKGTLVLCHADKVIMGNNVGAINHVPVKTSELKKLESEK